jgi:hypothetical protein
LAKAVNLAADARSEKVGELAAFVSACREIQVAA